MRAHNSLTVNESFAGVTSTAYQWAMLFECKGPADISRTDRSQTATNTGSLPPLLQNLVAKSHIQRLPGNRKTLPDIGIHQCHAREFGQ